MKSTEVDESLSTTTTTVLLQRIPAYYKIWQPFTGKLCQWSETVGFDSLPKDIQVCTLLVFQVYF